MVDHERNVLALDPTADPSKLEDYLIAKPPARAELWTEVSTLIHPRTLATLRFTDDELTGLPPTV